MYSQLIYKLYDMDQLRVFLGSVHYLQKGNDDRPGIWGCSEN